MLRVLIATISILCFASPVHADTPPRAHGEVELAIESGRLDQARLMIAALIKAGEPEERINGLLAHLAFAGRNDEEAIARYQALTRSNDPVACERAGIAALRLDRLAEAKPLLLCATAGPSVTWRSWNARGALADLEQQWGEAERAYANALAIDANNARIFNNMGFSRLLQGNWDRAASYFERAHSLDPSIDRARNNLELARAAMSENLPARLPNESATDWAARLNDAGVVAELLGDRRRAIANFTRALEASGSWYNRAANNLAAVQSK